jgi:hypothetical protein
MIIGLCGPAGAGKSTVADILCGDGRGVTIPLADPLYKALSAMFGIPEAALVDRGKKEQTIDWIGQSPRRLLQTLGTEWGRQVIGDDIWARICLRRAAISLGAGFKVVAVPDVRFDNEAAAIREAGGKIVRIVRPSGCVTSEAMRHSSEAGISDDLIDATIVNGGSMDELVEAVKATMKEYL